MNIKVKTSLRRLASPFLWLPSLVLVCSTLILTGCGQKGALYLPEDTAHQQSTTQRDKPCKENDCKQQ